MFVSAEVRIEMRLELNRLRERRALAVILDGHSPREMCDSKILSVVSYGARSCRDESEDCKGSLITEADIPWPTFYGAMVFPWCSFRAPPSVHA